MRPFLHIATVLMAMTLSSIPVVAESRQAHGTYKDCVQNGAGNELTCAVDHMPSELQEMLETERVALRAKHGFEDGVEADTTLRAGIFRMFALNDTNTARQEEFLAFALVHELTFSGVKLLQESQDSEHSPIVLMDKLDQHLRTDAKALAVARARAEQLYIRRTMRDLRYECARILFEPERERCATRIHDFMRDVLSVETSTPRLFELLDGVLIAEMKPFVVEHDAEEKP